MAGRVYQVHDLLLDYRTPEGMRPDFESLFEVIYQVAYLHYLERGDYAGAIKSYERRGARAAVLSQIEAAYRDIDRLLTILRAAYVPDLHRAQFRREAEMPPARTSGPTKPAAPPPVQRPFVPRPIPVVG
jgi:hypothetical protein